MRRREEREEAFEALIDDAWPGLVRLATALTGDRHAAEDLAQSALLSTYSHWSRLRDPAAAAGAYARTALVRDALRHRTRRRREDVSAAALGCSVGTVKSRVSRASASLRAAGLLDDEPRAPTPTGGSA